MKFSTFNAINRSSPSLLHHRYTNLFIHCLRYFKKNMNREECGVSGDERSLRMTTPQKEYFSKLFTKTPLSQICSYEYLHNKSKLIGFFYTVTDLKVSSLTSLNHSYILSPKTVANMVQLYIVTVYSKTVYKRYW